MPAIGMVTLSFNQRPYLEEAIESVLAHDLSRYVIVDPGSADGSRELIGSYRHRLAGCVFEPDEGPADGLNKGFDLLDTAVLGYLNGDDRLAAEALPYVSHFFDEHPHADVLCGAIGIIDERGRREWRRRTPDVFDLRRYAYEMCNVWQMATFFRREAFEAAGRFNPTNRSCWDGELMVDLALSGARFAYTDYVLGDFRVTRDSITSSIRSAGHWASVYKADRERIREKVLSRGVKPMRAAKAGRLWYRFDPRRHISYLAGWKDLRA